jgi:maleate isomerase
MAQQSPADRIATGRGQRAKRLGMLVPSSNTVVEPETAKLMPRDGSITCHFARLPVVTISSDAGSRGQFEAAPVAAAAALLADARVDLILWNGTASSWLGFDHDKALASVIEQRTKIPATTAVAGINAALTRLGARSLGLVSPYVASIEADIMRNYAGIGMPVVAAERLEITDNFALGEVAPSEIAGMIRAVARQRPDAIVVMCTNFAGADLVEPLGAELGIPIIDSVRTALEHCLERLRAA